jgi:general secretion pathway protein H
LADYAAPRRYVKGGKKFEVVLGYGSTVSDSKMDRQARSENTAESKTLQPSMKPVSPRLQNRAVPRGFTLVELLVVIAIMALIVGLMPVAFGRLHESAQYRDTVRAVLADMRAARQQALVEGSEVRFAVNLQQRRFGVEGGPQREVPEPLELRAVMAASETGGDGSMAVRFLPRGGASGGSVDVIRPSGSGVRLRVDWFSGRIEQEPVEP